MNNYLLNQKYFVTVLDKPTLPVINDVTESLINISWKTPPLSGGATRINGYLVTIFPDEGNPPNVEGTTANIKGLISNTEYLISVAALGSDGRSGDALERTVVTGMLNLQMW